MCACEFITVSSSIIIAVCFAIETARDFFNIAVPSFLSSQGSKGKRGTDGRAGFQGPKVRETTCYTPFNN